jgi:hypothetical protein
MNYYTEARYTANGTGSRAASKDKQYYKNCMYYSDQMAWAAAMTAETIDTTGFSTGM